MKILKCHIENFGKLSNVDYEFNEGLNTIKKQNGYGKTTFASFIKAMFYGLDPKRNTKALIDRKRFEPWQGGAFGGNIEIEVNGKQYRIERFFGKKETEDSFILYDLSTNLESLDYTQNIGDEMFKLNKEAYERSTYISGQNIETSMNDSINAKLGNILENENDINTSEQAVKILDEAIKNYKKTGGRGELNEKLNEKTVLEQKLEQSKIDEKTLEERKNKYEEIKSKIKEKSDELEKCQKIHTTKIQEETKRIIKEQYKNLKKDLEESKNALENYKNTITEDRELKDKIEFNNSKIENIKNDIIGLNNKIKSNKNTNKIMMVLIVICIILSIILFTKRISYVGIAMLLITGILIGTYVKKAFTINKMKNSYIAKKQEESSEENLVETLNSLYKKQQEDQNKELSRLDNEYKLKQNLKDNFEQQNKMYDLEEKDEFLVTAVIDRKEIEEKIKKLSIELNELNDEKNYSKNQIEILESKLDSVFDVEGELDELNGYIEEMQSNCAVLEKTKKFLQTAKEQFSTHYLGDMKESFIKNINLINGKDLNAELDVNLNAKINEKGSNKDIRYFSTGYKDLIYICMRLSLIEALFKDEKPFIILDDPFVNLDEDKIENALNLINNLSKEYQIIYFACHESRI